MFDCGSLCAHCQGDLVVDQVTYSLLCFNRGSSRSFGVHGSGVWTVVLHDSDLAVRLGLADLSGGGTFP